MSIMTLVLTILLFVLLFAVSIVGIIFFGYWAYRALEDTIEQAHVHSVRHKHSLAR